MEFTMLKTIKWYLWSLWKRVLLIGIFVIASSLLIYLGSSMGVDKTGGTFLLSLGSAILAIGLVTLVSEFITSTKILKIMRLYGDYAQHGILRIFPSKDDPEYKIALTGKFNIEILNLRI
jgi:glucose-6-phosphate-specific signal transduction histidine kinase